MLSFNELYITEDGKNLVIDVSVDEDSIYKGVYIDSIKLDLCKNLVTGNDVSNKAVTIYTPEQVILGDLDLDGDITTSDHQTVTDLMTSLTSGKTIYIDNERSVAALGLEGDGELTVSDIQVVEKVILDYLLYGKISYVPVKKRHVHICLEKNDDALVQLGVEDLSSALFMVRVDATGGDAESISNAGCGWDNSPIFGVAYNGKPMYDSAIRYAASYGDTCDNNDASALEDFILRYYSFLLALKCGDVKQACYYYNNYLTGAGFGNLSSGKNCGCHGTY